MWASRKEACNQVQYPVVMGAALTPDLCLIEVGCLKIVHGNPKRDILLVATQGLKSLNFSRKKREQLSIWSLTEKVDILLYDPQLWTE